MLASAMRFRLAFLFAAALTGGAGLVSAQSNSTAPTVVVISLDGFPAYALENNRLPIPNLRRLMREGSYATRMHTVNPTVTWPNHTTLVTGVPPREHGLLYNGTALHTPEGTVKVDPFVPKEKMVHGETLYDVAHRSGMTTAQMDWVAIQDAPTITWTFSEYGTPTDSLQKEMIAKGIISAADVADFTKANIVYRDQIWTKAATYLLRERHPNLILLHLLSLDSTHHSYAPRTLASWDSIGFLDGCVGQVLDAIEASGAKERTSVVVVSDHGFKAVEKEISGTQVLKAAGLDQAAQVIPEGGSAMIYLKPGQAADALKKVRDAFEGLEGVARVAGEDEFNSLGLPTSKQDAQAPQLIAYAKSGYAFGGRSRGGDNTIAAVHPATGAHGYINEDPEMDAIFIAWGAAFRQGVVLDSISNRQVAPTLAKILNLKLPRAREQPLNSVLK